MSRTVIGTCPLRRINIVRCVVGPLLFVRPIDFVHSVHVVHTFRTVYVFSVFAPLFRSTVPYIMQDRPTCTRGTARVINRPCKYERVRRRVYYIYIYIYIRSAAFRTVARTIYVASSPSPNVRNGDRSIDDCGGKRTIRRRWVLYAAAKRSRCARIRSIRFSP